MGSSEVGGVEAATLLSRSRLSLFEAMPAGSADQPPFNSVLDATVQAVRDRSAAKASRAAHADGLRRHQKVAKSLDETSRAKSSKRSAPPADPSAERLDRMRADEQASTRVAEDDASRVSRDEQGPQSRTSDASDRTRLTEASDESVVNSPAEVPTPTDAEHDADAGDGRDAAHAQTAPVAPTNLCMCTESAGHSADQAALNMPGLLPQGTSVGSAFSGIASVNANLPATVQVIGQTNGGQLRDTGLGTPSEGEQTAGATKTESTGPRPTSTGVNFQSFMQQSGRTRPGHTGQVATQLPVNAQEVNGTFRLVDAQSLQQLARVVRSAVGDRHSNVVLQLDPPELGSLRLDLRVHEQLLHMRIEADSQAGLDVLTSRLSDLRQSLQQFGIRLDSVDVALRPPPGYDADTRQDESEPRDPWSNGSDAQPDSDQSQGQGSGRFDGAAMPMEQPWYEWPDARSDGTAAVDAATAMESTGVDVVA